MILFGVYLPECTPREGCNSTVNLQGKIVQCFAELRGNSKAWPLDFLHFAKSEDELLQLMRKLLEIHRGRRLITFLSRPAIFSTPGTLMRSSH